MTFTRRHFMHLTAAGAALPLLGTACASGVSPYDGPQAVGMPMPSRVVLPSQPQGAPAPGSVGVAIIGLGGYALRQIMPSFASSPRTHIAGLVSGNPEKARTVGAAYGVPESAQYSYETFEAMADDERIDAVYIILPTGLHAEFAERAFAAGKHVLCEKPMALTPAECDRMIAAAVAADRKLMIGYRCHFEPYNVRAMELMRQRAVGDLRLIRTDQHYRMGPTTPAENWRANRALAGGGPLEDYGLYGVQSALYLSGEMPSAVSAQTFRPIGDPRFAEIDASVQTQMMFPSGAVAQLSTSYDAAGSNAATVRGTQGTLSMLPATGYEGNRLSVRTHHGEEAYELGDSGVQFAGQMEHFAAAIRDHAPLKTPGEMGRRDMRLIAAIYRAAELGRTVRLHPDGTING